MADKPEDGYEPTDDELDEIIAGVEAEDEESDQAVPETTRPASRARKAKDDAEDDDGPRKTAAGEDEDDETDSEAAKPTTPVAAPPAPVAAAPVASAPTIPAGATPFQYKASGGVHTLPGVFQLADGSLVATADARPELLRILASERELAQTQGKTRREYEKKLAAAASSKTIKEREAEAMSTYMDGLLKMTPEERWDALQQLEQKLPELKLTVAQQAIEAERAALQEERNPTLHPEEMAEKVSQALHSELQSTFQRLMALPEAAALDNDERIELWNRWKDRTRRLASIADADDPISGVKKGQLVFDDSDVADDFNRLVGLKKKLAGNASAGQKNERRNADQNGNGTNPIPPAVRTAVVASDGTPRGKDGRFKEIKDPQQRKKAFNKAFLAGDLDDADD